MDALVVLPTYNEAATLESVITRVLGSSVGVLVVDDASPDGTGAIADAVAAREASVSVLHRPAKSGLGSAYAAGFEWALRAGVDVIVQMDADGSHNPADVPRLLATVHRGADVAIGSRYVPGGGFDDVPWSRRVLSYGGNAYARLALGLRTRDATSGFRAYRAQALARIDPCHPAAQGYAFQIEMTRSAQRVGLRTVEVPIRFRPRQGGTSKMDPAVVAEAFRLVTRWGVARLRGR